MGMFLSIVGIFIRWLDSKQIIASYLVQQMVANPFNCSSLVINPTRNERFMISITFAITEIAILIYC